MSSISKSGISIQHIRHNELKLRDIHSKSLTGIHPDHIVKPGHHANRKRQYTKAAVGMNRGGFDDGLLADHPISIHYFFAAIRFCDVPMTGNELNGVFIVIRDVNGVDVQIL